MNLPVKRRSFIKTVGAFTLGTVASRGLCTADALKKQIIEVSQFHMNMLVGLTIYIDDPEKGYRLCRNAFERIRHYTGVFSCFDRKSELSRLSARAGAGPIKVSDELFEILSTAKTMAIQSDGAFDPTAGTLTRLWRTARRWGIPPATEDIKRASQQCGHQFMVLNEDNKTIDLHHPGMTLDLGGIAKGYIGDLTLQYFHQNRVYCAAYIAGGDIVAGDSPPGSKGWAIDVPDHKQPLFINNQAISISGDTHQFLTYRGQRYSHVLDPCSGQALVNSRPACNIAPTGLVADAQATLQSINNHSFP